MRTSPIDSSTRSLVPWARRWSITVVALSMAALPATTGLGAAAGATRPAARFSATARSHTAPDSSYITTRRQAGDFALVAKRLAAPLVVSAGDYPGAIRAADDLGGDIKRVTGVLPAVSHDQLPTRPRPWSSSARSATARSSTRWSRPASSTSRIAGQVGDLARAGRRQPAAGRRPRARDRRQRSARHHLRRVRRVQADRRLALVLLGRRAGAHQRRACTCCRAGTPRARPR